MNDHSARPTSFTAPMLLRFLATAKEAMERENGRGNEMPCSKAKEREGPGVKVNPRR